MPSTPYAKVLVSVDGGGPQSGGLDVDPEVNIALTAESTVGWRQQRWEIYDYPEGWTAPTGWNTASDGTIYSTAVTPDDFDLPSNDDYWGPWALRLRVNEAVDDDVSVVSSLVDESTALHVVSPSGLRKPMALESTQFCTATTRHKGWIRTQQRTFEALEAVVGVVGTWQTVLDLDFSAQPTQSLATDTDYTIDDLTWTEKNSASDRVAMALTNGTGLVVQPADAANRYDVDRNCPLLELRLNEIIPDFDPVTMGVRLWVHVSADNCAVQYDNAITAIDDGSAEYGHLHMRGFSPITTSHHLSFVTQTNNNINNLGAWVEASGAGNRVLVTQAAPVWLTKGITTMHGAYSGGWPALSALTKHALGGIGAGVEGVGSPAAADNTLWRIALGAMTYNGSAALSVTFKNVRVDYRKI